MVRVLHDYLNTFAPIKSIKYKTSHRPWIFLSLLQGIKRKQQAKGRAEETVISCITRNYKTLKNQLKYFVWKTKLSYLYTTCTVDC